MPGLQAAQEYVVSAPVDFTAPAPLGHFQAIEKAVELRQRGGHMTWRVIADVMLIYHGFDRSWEWWKRQLGGRVESRARGGAFVVGDPRTTQRKGHDPQVRAEAVRRLATENAAAIARDLGCSRSSIYKWAGQRP